MRIRWVALGLLVGLLCMSSHAQKAITIKFSHVVAADTPKGKASEYFAKRADELTNGKVKVYVYPNSQLYKDKEEIEALQIGAVQMLAPSIAKLSQLGVREFEVFDFPFLFDDTADLQRVTQGALGASLLAKLETKAVKGLAFWDNGFKSFSANTPLRTVADFKGKKFRIQSSKVLEEQIRALGGVPQVMAFSDVYQALRTGAVDGTENPISNLYSQQMHEVQQHLSISNHGYLGYAVIVNRKFWDRLPADLRGQLEQAMKEATTYANKIAQEENDLSLEAVKKSGKTTVHVLTTQERMALKKAMAPVHSKMADRVGKGLLEAIYQEAGFDANAL
jgi:C4-dicarboxylate-binding protein DctP